MLIHLNPIKTPQLAPKFGGGGGKLPPKCCRGDVASDLKHQIRGFEHIVRQARQFDIDRSTRSRAEQQSRLWLFGIACVLFFFTATVSRDRRACVRAKKKIGRYVPPTMQTAEITFSDRRRLWVERRLQGEDTLPKDPRDWTRENVAQWVSQTTRKNSLPQVPASKFPMNGKALCLMTPEMFLIRVPVGGKLLYRDFQLRLSAVLYGNNS